jgi:5'-3' exonuclease
MMVIFDLNHVAYRCLFSMSRVDFKENGGKMLKHMMFNAIFSTCKRFDTEEVVLCVDSKENWRKKIYPEYKQNRKEKRDEQDDIDWNVFFTSLTEFVEEVKQFFPFYVLQVKYMEADDIAGVLAKNWQNKPKIIVTSDGDYIQLLRYKNVQVFDPIKSKFLKCDDPMRQLKIKILTGDRGDNIKSVKHRVGEKTAEKIVDNPELLKEMFEDKTVSYTTPEGTEVTLGDEYKERYKQNMILIDLSKTPDVLVKALNKSIAEYQMPTGKEIFQYFSKNKFRDLMHRMEEIDQVIASIRTYQTTNKDKVAAFSDIFE